MPVCRTLRHAAAAVLCLLLLASSAAALGTRPGAHAATAGETIVGLAERELAKNVHEVPDGSNNSPDIARYRRATVGALAGAPWCAYFVSYIAKKAGVPIGYHGEGIGYVPYLRDWAHRTGKWRAIPAAGYLITFPEHVGIVEHVYPNHTLTSIEGNYANRVARVWHSWSDAMGYVRLAAATAPAEPPTAAKPAPTTTTHKLVARIHVYPDTTAAVGSTLQFTANDSSGNLAKEQWDLTGGGRWDAHGTNVSHTYAQAGTYTVKLRISDGRGHHSVTTQKVTIEQLAPPQPSFTIDSDSIHVGETVGFDASGSTDPQGRIVRYEWDYEGNGDFQAGGAEASHVYRAPGTYTARLRVTDDHGLTAESDQTLTVAAYDPPVAAIDCSATEISAGHTIHCQSDDSGSPYPVTHHDWDMTASGSYSLHGRSVSYAYAYAGIYVIHLRVTDENGNVAETTTPVQVDDVPPVAKISPPSGVHPASAVTFDGSHSYDPDGRIVSYEWDDGQGGGYQPGSSRLTATYAAPGAYTVRLRVTDDAGLTNVATYGLTVTAQSPIPSIHAPASIAHGQAATFDASSSQDPDWYHVKLHVTDAFGATAITYKWVDVG